MVAELANRINQPHVIDIYMRKVYKAGIEEGKRQAAISEKETAVLEGWVARDVDGALQLWESKPQRNNITNDEWGMANGIMLLPTSLFPSVTWQSEPKRVRITIEEIE